MHSNHASSSSYSALPFLDALPDLILVTGPDLSIRLTNSRARNLLESDGDSLAGGPLERVIPARFRDRVHKLAEAAISGIAEHTPVEIHARRGDGAEFPAMIGIRSLEVDSETLLLVSIRDVTPHKQVESELRTSQVLLAEAQHVAQLGSWRWDLVRDIITWSNELYRIWGVTRSEVPLDFQSFLQLIHPEDRARAQSTIQEAVDTQSSFEMEHRIIRPDGIVRLIYGQGAATFDENDNFVAMVGTAQDITERKANEAQAFQLALEQAARQEAERTKERFQLLAEVSESLNESLDYDATLHRLIELIVPRIADWCSINRLQGDGTINREAVAHRDPEKQRILESIRSQGYLSSYDPTHPLTRALRDGQPELRPDVTDEMLQRMVRSPEHLELARQLNPVSYMLVPLIARGKAFGVVAFGTTDGGRRYTQEDLQLAIEVTHRAAVGLDNAMLYREAQEAAQAREEFVSLVSHELKTPLTVIKGYMQVLERYLDRSEWERERIRTTGQRLSTQVERLELLVADILDVSRIQQGRLGLVVEDNVELVQLAREVMARYDDAIERKPAHELRIHAARPVHGRWDPLRLDQVFSNLISNALKYSPEGGPVEVEIEQVDDHAVVSVRDEGVGISENEMQTLFQPFQRGAASSRGISGTGLGLYITRQIVEQHGGTIWAHSGERDSTNFTMRLPMSPSIGEANAPSTD